MWDTENSKLSGTIQLEKKKELTDFDALKFVFFHDRYVYFGGDGAVVYRADYTLPKSNAEIFFSIPKENNFVFKTFQSGILSHDKHFIYLAASSEIYKVNIASRNLVNLFKHISEINHLAMTADGKYLCSWHYDGKIAFWNPINGKTEKHLQVAKNHTYGEVKFDYEGNYMLTAASDNVCKIWSLEDGDVNSLLVGHEKVIKTYAFAPTKNQIVTGSLDGEVRIWNKNAHAPTELWATEEVDITASENVILKKGTSIKLPKVHFEQNKTQLLTPAYDDLEQLYLLLLKYPNLKITLRGHTDSAIESANNYKLSAKRAEVVRQYLISKGIAAFRLETKGMGGRMPIYQSQNDLKKFNRRVEVVISDM